MKTLTLAAAAVVLCMALPSRAGSTCEERSGAGTGALIELYTSEGCSSCPPAERQLGQLRQQLDANAVVVALALHVSYWDELGWKDIFAQKIFDARQSELLKNRQRPAVVYTPQIFVNGAELRTWHADLPGAIQHINATPAPLTITLKFTPGTSDGALLVASVAAPKAHISGALYLAISESGLVSRVLRGENSGVTLRHDDTVRILLGPIKLAQGNARVRQQVKLAADWQRRNLHAIAFVQGDAGAGVLQVVSTALCD